MHACQLGMEPSPFGVCRLRSPVVVLPATLGRCIPAAVPLHPPWQHVLSHVVHAVQTTSSPSSRPPPPLQVDMLSNLRLYEDGVQDTLLSSASQYYTRESAQLINVRLREPSTGMDTCEVMEDGREIVRGEQGGAAGADVTLPSPGWPRSGTATVPRLCSTRRSLLPACCTVLPVAVLPVRHDVQATHRLAFPVSSFIHTQERMHCPTTLLPLRHNPNKKGNALFSSPSVARRSWSSLPTCCTASGG